MMLVHYIQRTAHLPWKWGVQDCTIWVADWCLIRWGIDPAAGYRGSYADEAGAMALTAGGLVRVVGPEISLARKHSPDAGDIGVVTVKGHQVAAIWSGAHWLFRTPGGIGMTARPAIAIWGE